MDANRPQVIFEPSRKNHWDRKTLLKFWPKVFNENVKNFH